MVPADLRPPSTQARGNDIISFQAVVSRLRMGEPYYPTVGDELRRGDYPTAHAFNWRTPLVFKTAASLPDNLVVALWMLLGFLMCCATVVVTLAQPVPVVVTAVLIQVGAVTAMDPRAAVVMGEAWSGVLMGLSVCAYVRGRPKVGMPLGLLALFVRELAAPYCVACTVMALFARRWREAAAWIAGAAAYAAYYGWHLTNIWQQQRPSDLSHTSPWLQFGGLAFVLLTVRFHRWLYVSPKPMPALALTLVVAGATNASTPLHVRVTSAVYLAFFLVAGQPFNQYWGLMAWPTWALACGYGLHGILESLNVVARGRLRPREAGAR